MRPDAGGVAAGAVVGVGAVVGATDGVTDGVTAVVVAGLTKLARPGVVVAAAGFAVVVVAVCLAVNLIVGVGVLGEHPIRATRTSARGRALSDRCDMCQT